MRGAFLLVVGLVCCALPLCASEAGRSEVATVFEVELEPASLTSVPRYLLIDDFERDSSKSHVGGFYDWDAASKSDRMTSCEIAWVSEGVSGGHLWSKYEYRGWLKVKKEYPDLLMSEWQKYAPNMTLDNLIGACFDTPFDRMKRSLSWTKMGNPAGPLDCGR